MFPSLRFRPIALAVLWTVVVLGASCASKGGTSDAGIADSGAALPDAAAAADAEPTDLGFADAAVHTSTIVCRPSSQWHPGTAIFRERLDIIPAGVEGTRVSTADLNGDGWADLFVRRGGNGVDDFTAGGVRNSWLLLNANGHFEDITQSSNIRGLRRTAATTRGHPGEVVAFADVDNDGDLDVYVGMNTSDGTVPGETSEIMFNDGTAHFELGPSSGPFRQGNELIGGASFVDVDRDGWVDLWVGRGAVNDVPQQAKLYRNLGDGRFEDATFDLGLTTLPWTNLDEIDQGLAHANAWSALACDLNNDGSPELLVASYGRAPNHVFRAVRGEDGSTSYVNESVASGYAFDQDQSWADNEFAKCYCQANRSAEGCGPVAMPQISCTQMNWSHDTDRRPFRLGGNSGTTVCADVDGDGDMDLLTTEITHWWAGRGSDRSELLLNTGDPSVRFTRPGEAVTGLSRRNTVVDWDHGDMTAAIFDFDNDGRPDVYLGASDYPGNHGLLYHQTEAGDFEAVPIAEGIDHHRSHGITVADFDHDGDLDVIVGHSRFRCDSNAPDDCYPTAQVRYFENVLGQGGNFLELELVGGDGTNRSAVGARVTVEADGRQQTQEVGGGHGHYGIQHEHVLHFGLGASCTAKVTVRWPSAELSTETVELDANRRLRWVQGSTPVHW